MSTVTITDLEPGTQATSAAVNATMTSWNSATASGQIGGNNVRVEGLDRRSMAGSSHVVLTTECGSGPVVDGGTSGSVSNVSGLYVVVTVGTTDLQTAQLTIASTTKVIVHASVFLSGARKQIAPAGLVQVAIQRSTNNGVSWSTLTGSIQEYRQSVQTTLVLVDPGGSYFIPGIKASPTWAYTDTISGGSYRYRVAYQTAAWPCEFIGGVIFVETLGV